LRGAEEKELPKVQLIWRDGQQSMHISPPRPRSASPKLFEPLVQYAVAGDDPVLMELALKVLLESEVGEPLLMDAVGQLVESEIEQLEKVSEAAIRVKPDESTGYWWRGIAAEKLKRVADAIDNYGRVIELSPEFDQVYSRRARLRGSAGDLPGARQDIETLIERNPKDAGLLVLHGQLWFDGEEYEKAICDIDAAIAIQKNTPGAFFLKGHSLIYLGRLPEAIESLSRAIELAPSQTSAWHLRAWARAKGGDLKNALQDIETLYAMAPDYAPAKELRDALRAESEKPPLE
jgi:tetratricopeptide (TPR) repeat protein